MRYDLIYASLVSKAQTRVAPDCYLEKHHIVPKSLGGTDDAENIVSLTAKEHFVAHHLLWKIHRNPQMTKAFMLMCNVKRDGVKYKISSNEYQTLRKDFSRAQSDAIKSRPGNNLGKTLPQEWRDNIAKGQKGKSRGKGRVSNFRGMKHTDDAKRILSEKLTGNKNRAGLTHSEDTKKMMSENRKGKTKVPWTEERKAARRELLAKKKLDK